LFYYKELQYYNNTIKSSFRLFFSIYWKRT